MGSSTFPCNLGSWFSVVWHAIKINKNSYRINFSKHIEQITLRHLTLPWSLVCWIWNLWCLPYTILILVPIIRLFKKHKRDKICQKSIKLVYKGKVSEQNLFLVEPFSNFGKDVDLMWPHSTCRIINKPLLPSDQESQLELNHIPK